MKIAGRREVLHVYDLTDNDKACLESAGYVYFENDVCGNEMWDREDNFFVEKSEGNLPLTTQFIYTQCNKNQWFTCGDNKQYERLFDMVREGVSLSKIADYISAHSDDISGDAVYEILKRGLVVGGSASE